MKEKYLRKKIKTGTGDRMLSGTFTMVASKNFYRSSSRSEMAKIWMFESPEGSEFPNFNGASARTLEKFV
jgi:hypothetical protein